MKKNKIYKPYFLIPSLVIYTLLFITPVVLNFAYSLTNWNAIKLTQEVAQFVGLSNFRKIFSDPDLLAVVTRTVLYAVITTILKNAIGFLLALFLNKGLKTISVLRAIFFLPSMLSPLIIGLVFGSILMKNGFFNELLTIIGLGELVRPWLTTASTAMGSVIFVDVWKQVGFNMVIYLAGLQLIDTMLYEAAAIDGANKRQQLISITIPRMIPSIIINLLLNMSGGLKTFDIVFALTGGGPNGKTELINNAVFEQYGQKLYGLSAAYGVIVFVITAIFGIAILNIKDDMDS